MLTRPQVQRYAAESSLPDIMIAEKEVVLTYMLQLLAVPTGPIFTMARSWAAMRGGICRFGGQSAAEALRARLDSGGACGSSGHQ
jgi:hypothetical protein